MALDETLKQQNEDVQSATPRGHVSGPPETLTYSKAYTESGALGGTRTPTILLTATSRQRVYQFRHERLGYRL